MNAQQIRELIKSANYTIQQFDGDHNDTTVLRMSLHATTAQFEIAAQLAELNEARRHPDKDITVGQVVAALLREACARDHGKGKELLLRAYGAAKEAFDYISEAAAERGVTE